MRLHQRTVETSGAGWHLIPVDNYVGARLIRHGWGGSFGTSAVPRLARKGVKRWGAARVHPPVDLAGQRGATLEARLVHLVDRDISDMLRRLDRYSSARAPRICASAATPIRRDATSAGSSRASGSATSRAAATARADGAC